MIPSKLRNSSLAMREHVYTDSGVQLQIEAVIAHSTVMGTWSDRIQPSSRVGPIIIRHSVLIITQEKINLTLSTLDIIEEGKHR